MTICIQKDSLQKDLYVYRYKNTHDQQGINFSRRGSRFFLPEFMYLANARTGTFELIMI